MAALTEMSGTSEMLMMCFKLKEKGGFMAVFYKLLKTLFLMVFLMNVRK